MVERMLVCPPKGDGLNASEDQTAYWQSIPSPSLARDCPEGAEATG